jgi:uncharacterized protein (TIGR03790 family)
MKLVRLHELTQGWQDHFKATISILCVIAAAGCTDGKRGVGAKVVEVLKANGALYQTSTKSQASSSLSNPPVSSPLPPAPPNTPPVSPPGNPAPTPPPAPPTPLPLPSPPDPEPIPNPNPGNGALDELAPRPTPQSDAVLVIVNQASQRSHNVAAYYKKMRAIPESNTCLIDLKALPNTTADYFPEQAVEPFKAAVGSCIERAGKTRILYLVLAPDLPFKIAGVGYKERGLAIESYLHDVYTDTTKTYFAISNPYHPAVSDPIADKYTSFVTLEEFRRTSGTLLYAVSRLDGETEQQAKDLVDRALIAERDGILGNSCIDTRFPLSDRKVNSGYGYGDNWMSRTGSIGLTAGLTLIEDASSSEFGPYGTHRRCDRAALYAGWYSYANYNDVFTYVPGAIVEHYDSMSLGNPRGDSTWVPNALRMGATAGTGAVSEPNFGALTRPDVYTDALVRFNANLGDAFFRATPFMRWMVINMGDPLFRPYPKQPQTIGSQRKLVVHGPVHLPVGHCAHYSVVTKDEHNHSTPSTTDLPMTLDAGGLISLYADSACSVALSGGALSIAANTTGRDFYAKALASSEMSFLRAKVSSSSSQANSVKPASLRVRSTRPTRLDLYGPATVTLNSCITLIVSAKSKPEFAAEAHFSNTTIQLTTPGNVSFFADSSCSKPLAGQLPWEAGSSKISVYLKGVARGKGVLDAKDSGGKLLPASISVSVE